MSYFPFTKMNDEKAQCQMMVLVLGKVYQNCPFPHQTDLYESIPSWPAAKTQTWTTGPMELYLFLSWPLKSIATAVCDSSRTCAAGRRQHPADTTVGDRKNTKGASGKEMSTGRGME